MTYFQYGMQILLGALLALEVGLLVNDPSPIIAVCTVFVTCVFIAHAMFSFRR